MNNTKPTEEVSNRIEGEENTRNKKYSKTKSHSEDNLKLQKWNWAGNVMDEGGSAARKVMDLCPCKKKKKF